MIAHILNILNLTLYCNSYRNIFTRNLDFRLLAEKKGSCKKKTDIHLALCIILNLGLKY